MAAADASHHPERHGPDRSGGKGMNPRTQGNLGAEQRRPEQGDTEDQPAIAQVQDQEQRLPDYRRGSNPTIVRRTT